MNLKMLTPALGFLLACVAQPVVAYAADKDALAELAERFCAARIADDEAATRQLLTPSLMEAIRKAEERNERVAKARPDEKPPFGDGIPYQAFPDTAPACVPGDTGEMGGKVTIQVRYEFPEEKSASWTDRLVTAEGEDGVLLVDDILYQQFPTDAEIHGLRRNLAEAFDQ